MVQGKQAHTASVGGKKWLSWDISTLSLLVDERSNILNNPELRVSGCSTPLMLKPFFFGGRT